MKEGWCGWCRQENVQTVLYGKEITYKINCRYKLTFQRRMGSRYQKVSFVNQFIIVFYVVVGEGFLVL